MPKAKFESHRILHVVSSRLDREFRFISPSLVWLLQNAGFQLSHLCAASVVRVREIWGKKEGSHEMRRHVNVSGVSHVERRTQ